MAAGPGQQRIPLGVGVATRRAPVAKLSSFTCWAGCWAGLQGLAQFQDVIEKQDKQAVPLQQQACLDRVGAVEEAMVRGFPFEVPQEYANLPQLKVRVVVFWGGGRVMSLSTAAAVLGGVWGLRGCRRSWLRCRGAWRHCKRVPVGTHAAGCLLLHLQGRATVTMDIKFGTPRDDNATGGSMTMVLDGFNAPVRCARVCAGRGSWVQ